MSITTKSKPASAIAPSVAGTGHSRTNVPSAHPAATLRRRSAPSVSGARNAAGAGVLDGEGFLQVLAPGWSFHRRTIFRRRAGILTCQLAPIQFPHRGCPAVPGLTSRVCNSGRVMFR